MQWVFRTHGEFRDCNLFMFTSSTMGQQFACCAKGSHSLDSLRCQLISYCFCAQLHVTVVSIYVKQGRALLKQAESKIMSVEWQSVRQCQTRTLSLQAEPIWQFV